MNRITNPMRMLARASLFLAASCGSALAQGDLNVLFTPSSADGGTRVFLAKTILTMEPANPRATAVAVAGDRILAVGSLDEVKKSLADRPFRLDERFAGKVLMPGLIEQHLHPLLGALCLSVEVIAIEDWELPGRTIPAARNRDEYFARLRQAMLGAGGSEGVSLHMGLSPALARRRSRERTLTRSAR